MRIQTGLIRFQRVDTESGFNHIQSDFGIIVWVETLCHVTKIASGAYYTRFLKDYGYTPTISTTTKVESIMCEYYQTSCQKFGLNWFQRQRSAFYGLFSVETGRFSFSYHSSKLPLIPCTPAEVINFFLSVETSQTISVGAVLVLTRPLFDKLLIFTFIFAAVKINVQPVSIRGGEETGCTCSDTVHAYVYFNQTNRERVSRPLQTAAEHFFEANHRARRINMVAMLSNYYST